jgi:TorA maturation chaperone TorD
MSVREWFLEAVRWRAIATAFMPPNPGWLKQLRGLLSELSARDRALLGWMAACDEERLASEHHVILGHACRVSPCESEHVGDRLGSKGAIISDVSGFYRAFAYPHAADLRENPDHIAVELSFVSFLALKSAYAQHERHSAAVSLCRDAQAKFFRDHLLVWTPYFAAALQEAAPLSCYTRLAGQLTQLLERSQQHAGALANR